MINVEYKESGFNNFFKEIKDKKVAIVSDINTRKYADDFKKQLNYVCEQIIDISFDDKELVPDENAVATILAESKTVDYILAVGSGTLNDLVKAVSTTLNIKCGCLATATSMDGYCSKGSALMRNGVKVTDKVHSPSDILIDYDLLKTAPQLMTGAGFADIMGKFTCLTDWQLSNILNGESINNKAFSMMEQALEKCFNTYEQLKNKENCAIKNLMDALVYAGLAMAESGDSRPASGSEHHISHYLEMWFVKNKLPIPLHGVKVGLGTLVSIEIYNYIKDNLFDIPHRKEIVEIIEKLPKVEVIKEMLNGLGCPTRFSQLGISKELFYETIENAHTVRDRYTVLTFVAEKGLTKEILPILEKKYY